MSDANGSVDPSTGVDGDATVDVGVVTPNSETNVNVNGDGIVNSDIINGNAAVDVSVLVAKLSPELQAKINDAAQKYEIVRNYYSNMTSEERTAVKVQVQAQAEIALNDAINNVANFYNGDKSEIETAKNDAVALLQEKYNEVILAK